MTVDERQTATLRYMYGEWTLKKDDISIEVRISALLNKVTLSFNGEKIEFSDKGDWFGPYNDEHHYVMGHYYVYHADEMKLVFGKHTTAGVIGHVEWQYTLNRVK